MTLFRHDYEALLHCILTRGETEINGRTGRLIKMLRSPHGFSLDLGDRRLPVCGIRKTFPKTAAAEVAWFMMGTQDAAFITKHCPIWDKFIETWTRDRKAGEGGPFEVSMTGVKAAYGYRWRRHFGRDQVDDALGALLADPSNRRVWIQAWDPSSDGLGAPGQRNVPCPIGFTLSIVGGRLNSCLLLRSSDVFVGLPYDVMGHALFLDAFAASYNLLSPADEDLALGDLHVTLAHPHVYGVHFDMAAEALVSQTSDDTLTMPGWTISEVEADPDGYVAIVADLARGVRQPSFMCRPEVVE